MQNRFVMMHYLKKQAENGTADEKTEYADWMVYNCPDQINDTNIDMIKACYMVGIKEKDVRAMLGMGLLYEEGYGETENIPAAMRLYRRAYKTTKDEYEEQMSATLLARLYLESEKPEDWETAGDLICEVGENMTDLMFAPYAMVMGDMQKSGTGLKKSPHSAYESYIVAKSVILSTEENRRFLPDMLIRYGEIYAFGLYVSKDPLKAEGYFAEAEDLLGSGRRSRMSRERIRKDRAAMIAR